MVTSERTDRRWWWTSGLVVALALLLAGGGIALSLRQGSTFLQARIRGLQGCAETVSTQLQDELQRQVDERFTRIRQGYVNQDDAALDRLAAEDEWVELIFVYDRWALMTWPATTVARSDRLQEAFAPPGFGVAEQLEFVDGKLDEAVRLYQRCTGEGTQVYWQLRAHMAIAACRAKQRRFTEAIEIYERLRTRYATILRGMDSPSLFSVHLALIDVLTAADRRDEAARQAEALVRRIVAGQVPLPAREYADLLVHRLKGLTNAVPEEIRQTERQLASFAQRQHALAGAASVVRTWMEPRLDPPLGTEERDVQFVSDTLGARARALAYARLEIAGRETVIGVCIHLSSLYESLIAPATEAFGGGSLIVVAKDAGSTTPPPPWTRDLAQPLHAWRLQPAEAFVTRVQGEVRRQTWVYIALTLGTLVVLVAAMAVLMLAVRREMALTRLKSEFVANVSHELKTPLSLIRLFGETLLYGRAANEEKRREYYSVITRESERLTHLINNILDFSRIDAGHKRYKRTDCDVGEVVAQTLDTYRFHLDHHGFDCRLDIASNVPTVSADANAISQAVLNLLNNAVKYSRDVKVVEVRVEPSRHAGRDGVMIAVADHGMGITARERGRLFESFFRGEREEVRATRGSGLGLALVHHIVTGHDGEIWVDSTPGQGSTFSVFLPAVDPQSSGEPSCRAS